MRSPEQPVDPAPSEPPPRAAPFPRLVADVGGTHARFGLVPHPGAPIERIAELPSADYPGLAAAIASYREAQRVPPLAAAAIAVAATVTGDAISMTNLDWSFSIDSLRRALGVERLLVVNDFAALALSLPMLTSGELRSIGGGAAVAGEPVALLGPGTGLGVAGLVGLGEANRPISGEGGHATLSAFDEKEDQVIAYLRARYGHASAERALSGKGLVDLYRHACARNGRAARNLSPPEVSASALAGADDDCVEAVDLFFALLGGFAGNLALTFGARGGVYIGGGIVPQLGDWIERSAFRARFEAKGRFASFLAAIPVWVIEPTSPPALRGANAALDR